MVKDAYAEGALMGNFYVKMASRNLLSSCATLFDWLFDESRFDSFSKADVNRITNGVKELLANRRIKYYPLSKVEMISYSPCNRSEGVFAFATSKSAGRDFTKHIRNAIAHGHANISTINRKLYVTLVDYYNPQNKENRSAFINIPLNDFVSILRLCRNKGTSKA